MVGTPLVSVIIPTHDRAPLVERAVRSVLAQTVSDLEVVVVDDASTDDTEAVIAALADPRVRYLRRDEQGGCSAARNAGIDAAAGRHLAFLDSDDEWLPDKLARQMSALASAPEGTGIAVCGVATQTGQRIALKGSGDIHRRVLEHRFPARCSTFLLSPAATASGPRFDENLPAYTDWDFLLRLSRRYGVANVPEVLVIKHEQRRRVWSGKNIVEGGLAILDKHREELASSRAGRAAVHEKIAAAALSLGDHRRARRHLLSVIRAWPRRPGPYARYAALLLGPAAHRRLFGG